jgi:hypothetical protein
MTMAATTKIGAVITIVVDPAAGRRIQSSNWLFSNTTGMRSRHFTVPGAALVVTNGEARDARAAIAPSHVIDVTRGTERVKSLLGGIASVPIRVS